MKFELYKKLNLIFKKIYKGSNSTKYTGDTVRLLE